MLMFQKNHCADCKTSLSYFIVIFEVRRVKERNENRPVWFDVLVKVDMSAQFFPLSVSKLALNANHNFVFPKPFLPEGFMLNILASELFVEQAVRSLYWV